MASTSALEKEVKDLKAENKRLQKIIDDRKKSTERGKQSSFSKGRGGGASSSGMGRGGGQAGASTAGGNKVTWASIVDGHCWAYNNGEVLPEKAHLFKKGGQGYALQPASSKEGSSMKRVEEKFFILVL